jgi:hypothetical protein
MDNAMDIIPAATKANPPAEVTAEANLSDDANAIGATTIGLVTSGAMVLKK